jgi:hypothetical protein
MTSRNLKEQDWEKVAGFLHEVCQVSKRIAPAAIVQWQAACCFF